MIVMFLLSPPSVWNLSVRFALEVGQRDILGVACTVVAQ